MKRNNWLAPIALILVLAVSIISVSGQTQTDPQKTRQRTTAPTQDPKKPAPKSGDRLEPDDTAKPTDVPDETQANRMEQALQEALDGERRTTR
jgi:hypothetical protein